MGGLLSMLEQWCVFAVFLRLLYGREKREVGTQFKIAHQLDEVADEDLTNPLFRYVYEIWKRGR